MRFGLLCILLLFSAGRVLAAAEPLLIIPEMVLRDGTVLHNVKIIGFGANSVTARWDGGRGVIARSDILRADLSSLMAEQEEIRRRHAPEAKPPPAVPGVELIPEPSADLKAYSGVIYIGAGLEEERRSPLANAMVRAYKLDDFIQASRQSPDTAVVLEPITEAQTDELGRWTLRVPPGVEFIVQAEAEHIASQTGKRTLWTWRVPVSDLVDNDFNEFNERNAAVGAQRSKKKPGAPKSGSSSPTAIAPGRSGGGQR